MALPRTLTPGPGPRGRAGRAGRQRGWRAQRGGPGHLAGAGRGQAGQAGVVAQVDHVVVVSEGSAALRRGRGRGARHVQRVARRAQEYAVRACGGLAAAQHVVTLHVAGLALLQQLHGALAAPACRPPRAAHHHAAPPHRHHGA
ncbi:hypothetical protein E2C01_056968 [Portunus trituberculatus]|uniref:Uncharacterized protein n=1 Tax=Portunus trituberculatus TaxID=210409 RepID=A0A5B7H0K3_PORTR|nr:hypothetical protein [Portunus trituberculatus]